MKYKYHVAIAIISIVWIFGCYVMAGKFVETIDRLIEKNIIEMVKGNALRR